jgi:hypothetical protein
VDEREHLIEYPTFGHMIDCPNLGEVLEHEGAARRAGEELAIGRLPFLRLNLSG